MRKAEFRRLLSSLWSLPAEPIDLNRWTPHQIEARAEMPHRSASIPPSRGPPLVQSQDAAPAVDRLQRPARPADHLGGIELRQLRVLLRSPGSAGFRRSCSPAALGSAHLRPGLGRVFPPSVGLPGRLHGTCRRWLATLGSCGNSKTRGENGTRACCVVSGR